MMRKLESSCFCDHLLGRQLALVLLALLEVGDLAREVVVVGLDGGAAGRDLGEAGPPAPWPIPARCAQASISSVGGGPLVAHVDGRRRALEDVELLDDLGQLGDGLHGGGAGADDADRLPSRSTS